MSQPIGNRHHADAVLRGGKPGLAELLAAVGIIAADPGQAGVAHHIREVEVEFLLTPCGVAGQDPQQDVQPLHLAREVPLEGSDRR